MVVKLCLESVGDDGVKLWKNASLFQKDEPNIIVNKQNINTTEKSEVSNNIVVGDCVKLISGLFQHYYAMVIGSSYDHENDIQYFTQTKTISGAKYWVLKENDHDSREKCQLKKVVTTLDNRDHFTFSDYQTVQKFALTVSHV